MAALYHARQARRTFFSALIFHALFSITPATHRKKLRIFHGYLQEFHL